MPSDMERFYWRAYAMRRKCKANGLPVPEWAKLVERPKKIYVSPERKSNAPVKPDVITPEAIRRCRAYCRKAHVDYPPWAAMTASKWLESQRPPKEAKAPVRERDIFNASLVLTDVRLALWSGCECFWRRAEEEAPCLMDQNLTDAITRRSEEAWAEAMRVCMELNPDFGKPEKSKPEKHVATDAEKELAREYARKNASEKTAAWRRFKTENGIATPPKDSNRITRVARVECAR